MRAYTHSNSYSYSDSHSDSHSDSYSYTNFPSRPGSTTTYPPPACSCPAASSNPSSYPLTPASTCPATLPCPGTNPSAGTETGSCAVHSCLAASSSATTSSVLC